MPNADPALLAEAARAVTAILPGVDPALLAEAARAAAAILEGRRVVRSWVLELPPKQQVSLLVALRGPDDGNEAGKELVRRLRYAVLQIGRAHV